MTELHILATRIMWVCGCRCWTCKMQILMQFLMLILILTLTLSLILCLQVHQWSISPHHMTENIGSLLISGQIFRIGTVCCAEGLW